MPLLSRNNDEATPICRCRVLYLGSAVPHVTKDGLQGIQEPLRQLYPDQGALGARGIDSWLSVWSNGLLLENVDENHKKVTRFFPIESLHYCAAVRYVLVPEKSCAALPASQSRFLPLDSPFARTPNPNHPPLFAAILRRTTGIKVLECHAFICKREVAANALVRCCFHAYADFSYAKQIENGGATTDGNTPAPHTIYSTLCNGRQSSNESIEKVEGWRRSQPPNAGSTFTLNSAVQNAAENGISANIELSSNSVDDVSIYDGDENHKVWIGSSRDIGDRETSFYGTSRSTRPRQITNAAAPPPPPPPPPQIAKQEKSKKVKDRCRRKKTSEGSRDDLYCVNGTLIRQNGHMANGGGLKSANSVSGGTVARGYYPRANGGCVYPSNGNAVMKSGHHVNGFHPPPIMMVPTTLPHRPRRVSTGSYSKSKSARPILVPLPRHMIPPPPPPSAVLPFPPQPIYVQTGKKLSKHCLPVAGSLEEPIYMPSTRPMSPVASYQPGHFPHEAYLMQQHAASMETKAKGRKKHKKNSKEQPSPMVGQNGVPRMHGDEDDELDEGDSVYNTGIYKRKGHLNERAFSYSIRQEHRSRSHGSLANLKFAPPPVVSNGVNKDQLKQEREIMQMMHDLDLSGDDLERSEVPAAVYQTNKTKSSNVRR